MTDRTFIAPTSVLPDDMQWNGANDSNYPDRPGFVIFDRLVYFRTDPLSPTTNCTSTV